MTKTILALFILLCFPVMINAQTKLQNKDNENSGAGDTLDITLDSNQTTGSANIVSLFFCNNIGCSTDTSGVTVSVTDDHSNSYSVGLNNIANANRRILTVYNCNITGGTNTIHISLSGGTGYYLWGSVSEWSTIADSSCLDQTGTSSTTGSNPTVSTGGATSQADELVIGVVQDVNTVTPDSSTIDSATNNTINTQYKIVSSTGTQTITWTAASEAYSASIITFKKDTGGGGGSSFVSGLRRRR